MSWEWQEELRRFLRPSTVLVAIGNPLRGDDGFGPALAERIREKSRWPIVNAEDAPENCIGQVASFEPERVLLLDAVKWGAEAGRVGFFPADVIPWGGVSTHASSLRLFAEVLSARTGCVVGLLGVAPKSTDMGSPLTPEVESALNLVERFLAGGDFAGQSPGGPHAGTR